jgi:hypothetical protein
MPPGLLPFPPVAASWQAGINRALSSLQHLTQLRHLQLRFICGERGALKLSCNMLFCECCFRLALCPEQPGTHS